MSGIGYSWVHGKMIYGAQMGVGYSFNKVDAERRRLDAFGVAEPVCVDVSNSWVVRPQVKAEYFVHRKVSVRTQLSYTYTDPDVVIRTGAQDIRQRVAAAPRAVEFRGGLLPVQEIRIGNRRKEKAALGAAFFRC